jgi:hypothetical protein
MSHRLAPIADNPAKRDIRMAKLKQKAFGATAPSKELGLLQHSLLPKMLQKQFKDLMMPFIILFAGRVPPAGQAGISCLHP